MMGFALKHMIILFKMGKIQTLALFLGCKID